jgi:acyl-CoA synthetase (AMP-forming)/AMP-acid ligase II
MEGHDGEVAMRIEEGSLRIKSRRNAVRYLGGASAPLVGPHGFVDTGDMLEMRNGRYYFVGRRDGIINIGGLKVHPEEVEAIIDRHPSVRMSLVRARKNPIIGALIAADVVVNSINDGKQASTSAEALKLEILESCRRALAPFKVPATIRFVTSLEFNASGKLARPHA